MRKLLYFFLFIIALCITVGIASCTRTVKDVTETHDTIIQYVEIHDSTNNLSHKTDTVCTVKTDTVYTVKTDTVVKIREKIDSVIQRDSVYIKEKGESVIVYKEHWNTQVKYKTDTVYKSKTDTVYKSKTDTVKVIRFVERKDSVYSSSDKDKLKVKEKRQWVKWGSIIGVIALLGLAWFFFFKKKS